MEDDYEHNQIKCTLTLEDEFLLTRIREKAKSLKSGDQRDQFFWNVVLRLVSRERAFSAVLEDIGTRVAVNIPVLDD
jgi:hypothetical protein